MSSFSGLLFLFVLWQALKALLEISWEYGWADEVHCRLIRIACNLLYRLPADETLTSKPSLDLDQIEILGGIETICAEVSKKRLLLKLRWSKIWIPCILY